MIFGLLCQTLIPVVYTDEGYKTFFGETGDWFLLLESKPKACFSKKIFLLKQEKVVFLDTEEFSHVKTANPKDQEVVKAMVSESFRLINEDFAAGEAAWAKEEEAKLLSQNGTLQETATNDLTTK